MAPAISSITPMVPEIILFLPSFVCLNLLDCKLLEGSIRHGAAHTVCQLGTRQSTPPTPSCLIGPAKALCIPSSKSLPLVRGPSSWATPESGGPGKTAASRTSLPQVRILQRRQPSSPPSSQPTAAAPPASLSDRSPRRPRPFTHTRIRPFPAPSGAGSLPGTREARVPRRRRIHIPTTATSLRSHGAPPGLQAPPPSSRGPGTARAGSRGTAALRPAHPGSIPRRARARRGKQAQFRAAPGFLPRLLRLGEQWSSSALPPPEQALFFPSRPHGFHQPEGKGFPINPSLGAKALIFPF